MRERAVPNLLCRAFARALGTLALLTLPACADRGAFSFAEVPPDATLRQVWVAKHRTDIAATRQVGPPRPDGTVFERYQISIPPAHVPGQIEWPSGQPDPQRHFVTKSAFQLPSAEAFATRIAAADRSGNRETLLFVHGYNMRHAEATYQLAQIAHDFEVDVPAVLFSWPSAGIGAGYLYDRDSVLISRDALEAVIRGLSKGNRRLVILAHSMGSQLVMETLRQIEIAGDFNIDRAVTALFLVSPDIDGEVFRNQARRLSAMPDPTIIVVAEQDAALRLSARLSGRPTRLGSQTTRELVGDLPVSIINVSRLADGRSWNHLVGLTSGAAIAIINRLNQAVRPGDASIAEQLVLLPDGALP